MSKRDDMDKVLGQIVRKERELRSRMGEMGLLKLNLNDGLNAAGHHYLSIPHSDEHDRLVEACGVCGEVEAHYHWHKAQRASFASHKGGRTSTDEIEARLETAEESPWDEVARDGAV